MASAFLRRGARLIAVVALATPIFQIRLTAQAVLSPDMVYNLSGLGNAAALFDSDPATVFEPKHFAGFAATPATVILRLSPEDDAPRHVSKIRFEAVPGASGTLQVFAGRPGPGGWTALSPAPQVFDNQHNALEWSLPATDAAFLKFVFAKPGESLPQQVKTGSLSLWLDGSLAAWSDGRMARSSKHSSAEAANHRAIKPATQMGVNNFVGKSQLYWHTGPFAAVREYLPWDHVQGHATSGNNSPASADQPFRFAPCFPGYDLDRHYGNLADFGREVLGTFKESSPFQLSFNYATGANDLTMNQLGMSYNTLGQAYLDLMERKPGRPASGVGPNNPEFCRPQTYADHAQAFGKIAQRYGQQATDEPNAGPRIAGAGSFKFLENWNEQDKWWLQPATGQPVNPACEQRLAFFTPEEYMAMTHADRYEGNPALPMVMGGLTDFDATWVRGAYMAWWELTGANPATNFPFAALNMHHYSVDNWQNGIAPETDPQLQPGNPASNLLQIAAFRDRYLPGTEIWVTEFGFSDHPDDATAALPHYPNADLEEVQARWLVRNYLLFNELGVERAFTYQLADDGPNQWSGWFNHTGVVDLAHGPNGTPQFRAKKAWYYLYTLSQILKESRYLGAENGTTQGTGRPVWIYKFEKSNPAQTIRAIWVPQDQNPGFERFDLAVSPGSSVRVVELANGSIAGAEAVFTDSDGDGLIGLDRVGERPIFVLEGALPATTSCQCAVPLTLVSGRGEVMQALIGENDAIAATRHPRCDYGSGASEIWQGDAEILTLNLGGDNPDDAWQVEGVFLHDPAGQEGDLDIEFLDKNFNVVSTLHYGLDGQAMYPFNVGGENYVWKRFENLQVSGVSSVRVSKSEGAAVGEMLICAKPLAACSGDGAAPASPLLSLPIVNGQRLDLAWQMPANAPDFSGFQVRLLDSLGASVVAPRTVFAPEASFDISALPCGRAFTVELTARDCEGLISLPGLAGFQTPACTPPPPPPGGSHSDCDCEPLPLSLSASDVWYELASGQQVPASTFTGDACADNVPDKSPFRMVDEQHLLATLCGSGYDFGSSVPDFYTCGAGSASFPVREWFPGWPGGTARYPFRAILHFREPLDFNGLYLYDGSDQGRLSVEFRTAADAPWQLLALPDGKTYLTDAWRKWVPIFRQGQLLTASDVRVTLKDEHARFAELAFCKNEIVRRAEAESLESEARNASNDTPALFPNPTGGAAFLRPGNLAFTQISLHDLAGRQVLQLPAELGQNEYWIDLQGLASGVYILAMSDGGRVVWRGRLVRR